MFDVFAIDSQCYLESPNESISPVTIKGSAFRVVIAFDRTQENEDRYLEPHQRD